MAVFKIAEDSNGERVIYETEEGLRNVLDYILRKSKYTEVAHMIPGDSTVLANQFSYIQKCRGGELTTRALHFILSFDSYGWEWEMDQMKTIECVHILNLLRSQFALNEYQTVFAVHDNGHTCHIHIAMNPVNVTSKTILHYSLTEFKMFKKELAKMLYMFYGVALLGISYIAPDDRLNWGYNEFLYENRQYPSEKLRNRQ